jgi:hypothetical protein
MKLRVIGIQRYLQASSALIILGLLVEIVTLLWFHPLSFVLFLFIGVILIGFGIVVYLLSLVFAVVLQAPTPAMKTAGMVPLTLSAADMQALVSYVSSLGGTSAAAPTATGLSTPAPAVPAKPESKAKRTLKWLFAPSFPH